MSVTNFTLDDFQAVLERSAIDEAFHQLCLSNPSAALEEVTGKTVPESFKLRFIDNTGFDLTLVLPELGTSRELSNEQRRAVTAGLGSALSMHSNTWSAGEKFGGVNDTELYGMLSDAGKRWTNQSGAS